MVIPEWVTVLLTGVMALGVLAVVVTWAEAFQNWRAVNDTDLQQYAKVKLIRASILGVTMVVTFLVYLLSVVYHPPRPALVSVAMIFGLIGITVGIALLSLHEFIEMRIKFNGDE